MTQTTVAPPNDVSHSNAEVKVQRRRWVIRATVAIVVVVLAFVLWKVLKGPGASPNIISLSGRIEGDDSAIASKTSGRILEVRFREGDSVHQGDVIAVLDDEQI